MPHRVESLPRTYRPPPAIRSPHHASVQQNPRLCIPTHCRPSAARRLASVSDDMGLSSDPGV